METITTTGTQYATIKAALLSDLLTGAAIAAHAKNDLPILNAVSLSVAGGSIRVAATDRYRLIVGQAAALESDLLDAAIIPLSDVKRVIAAIKALPKIKLAAQEITLTRSGDLLSVTIGSDTLTLSLYTAGNFPPVDHLLQQTPSAVETISINADLLASFAKVPGNKGQNTFTFTGDRKPVLVTIPHDLIKWHALIMPMRLA